MVNHPNRSEITKAVAEKVLATVDAGLVKGLGESEPGKMCVEAAVCYAMGLPHSDNPGCVSSAVRWFKIALNDADWSSNAARAKGMRRLALIQLGSVGVVDNVEFVTRLAMLTVNVIIIPSLQATRVPKKLIAACEKATTLSAAIEVASSVECAGVSRANTKIRAATAGWAAARVAGASAMASASARAASVSAGAASAGATAMASVSAGAAARAAGRAATTASNSDLVLAWTAEHVVRLLVGMDAPGAQWLSLAPL